MPNQADTSSSAASNTDTPSTTTGDQSGTGADLHLDLAGPGSSKARLMRALREAIRSGRLAPDTRLPPYRTLANDLAIARNTVAGAYAELVEEGWLTARQGSGTRVARRATPSIPASPAARPAPPATASPTT